MNYSIKSLPVTTQAVLFILNNSIVLRSERYKHNRSPMHTKKRIKLKGTKMLELGHQQSDRSKQQRITVTPTWPIG